MATKKICPTPVKRPKGGAAPKCVACAVSEDWCYRLATDTATVTRAGKHTYDIDEQCNRTNEKWTGDDGAEIDRCTVALTELLCGGGGGGGSGVPPTPTPPTDRELVKRCDPDTGAEILFMWDVTVSPPVLLSATDLTTGAPWTGDPTTLSACEGAVGGCVPTISSAYADAMGTLLPGHSISIQKSNCCKIKIKTSAGDFIISKGITGYSTSDFKCPVTVNSVEIMSGTCTLADVLVTTQNLG